MSSSSTPRKLLIIGAGVAGSAVARLCADQGCRIDLFEETPFIGGHCSDEYNEYGVLVHRFGPHYFRTDSDELLAWLSRFTEWIPGQYYVRALVGEKLIPVPISLATISALKGRKHTSQEFQAYLSENRLPISDPKNAEEQCLGLVGPELYESLFRGYTEKQWGVPARNLAASVTKRIPLRFNWDERYPSEKHQLMPKDGYTRMFERMLDHPHISLNLKTRLTDKEIFHKSREYDATVYTGPIDALFDHKFGELGYRSLRFEWRHYEQEFVQPCVQINYPNDHDYTRTVEIKHVTGQKCPWTSVAYEYSTSEGPPFYPLLTEENKQRYEQYAALLEEIKLKHRIHLIGRLAEFLYLNMDHVFLRSLKLGKDLLRSWQ